MSSEPTPPPNNLLIQPSLGLAPIAESTSPVLSEIINRSLVHIHTSKTLNRRHRIGEHELYSPDYRLVCAWAEEFKLLPDEVLKALQTLPQRSNLHWDYHRTTIVEGRFRSLYVDCNILGIEGLPQVEGLILDNLSLHGKGVLDLDLSVLPNLKSLAVDYTGFHHLNLSSTANLRKISCTHNNLREIDLSQVPHLTELWCDDNKLIELNISAVAKLEKLSFSCNKLTSIDLSVVPNLTYLDCDSNLNLNSINLSAVPKLTELSCGYDSLTELDLSKNPNIKNLSCGGNQLAELDLSCLSMLSNLSCMANQLKTIDLSTVPNLTELWCGFNELTELNLSVVTRLKKLYCDGNKLTGLDISRLPNLHVLHCEDNLLSEIDISKMKKTDLSTMRGYLEMLELRCDDHVLITHRPDQRF